MERTCYKTATFWIAILLVIITAFLMAAVYTRFLMLHILIEEVYIHHWLSWAGALFIAFFTPAYHFLKRRYPKKYGTMRAAHVFGNLIAVMFVSIHFTQQISRPPQAFPHLGTGIVLYAAMILLVLTGFFLRFRPVRHSRFLHTSVAVSFYLIIVVHVLHGLEVI